MMTELQRHRVFFKCLKPACELFVRLRFNYTFDSLKDVEGPYLLLPNHNLELDPILVGVATGNHLYFVASEHLQRKGIVTKLMNYFLKPITRQKGTSGANTVAKILRTLRSGTSVCIFPEGNRSFNGCTGEILPATGKMARRSGVKLVTYRFEGGYLTQPRWSTTLRRGKIRGRLVHVYSPEELSAMTDKEVNLAICRDLYEDAYETQALAPVPFKGKNLALGMESTVFACPACGSIGSLKTNNTSIFCSCGFHGDYNEFGYVVEKNGAKHSLMELDQLQRNVLRKKLSEASDLPLFSDDITLHAIGSDHTLERMQHGKLAAFADRLEICGEPIPLSDLQGVAIYSRNVLVIYTNAENHHYELRGPVSFSALKYQYWYDEQRKNAD